LVQKNHHLSRVTGCTLVARLFNEVEVYADLTVIDPAVFCLSSAQAYCEETVDGEQVRCGRLLFSDTEDSNNFLVVNLSWVGLPLVGQCNLAIIRNISYDEGTDRQQLAPFVVNRDFTSTWEIYSFLDPINVNVFVRTASTSTSPTTDLDCQVINVPTELCVDPTHVVFGDGLWTRISFPAEHNTCQDYPVVYKPDGTKAANSPFKPK